MDVELLHVVAGGTQVLAGVELGGFGGEDLADGGGHGQTRVGVDVDLADGALGGLAKLLLGNAHGSLQRTAVLVDRLDFLLGNRRRTVQHDGEARKLLLDGGQYVESQGRRNQTARLGIYGALLGGELVGSVRGSDRNGQRIHARLGHKIHDLFGFGVVADFGGYLVLDAGQHAQFAFDRHVVFVCILHDLLRQGDVFVVGKCRTVDHHRREAHVHAALAQFERISVVEVQHDLGFGPAQFLGVLYGSFGHVAQQGLVGVVARTLRYLEDDGRLGLGGSHDDSLELLHVVEVECRNGVTSFDGLGEHLARVHKTQIFVRYHSI